MLQPQPVVLDLQESLVERQQFRRALLALERQLRLRMRQHLLPVPRHRIHPACLSGRRVRAALPALFCSLQLDSVSFHFRIQSRPVNAQDGRRLLLVSVALRQRLEDRLPLPRIQLQFVSPFAGCAAASCKIGRQLQLPRADVFTVTVAPSHNTTLCSMAFCNSRTFPGQL